MEAAAVERPPRPREDEAPPPADEDDERVPVTVCLRLKPNPDNMPAVLHAKDERVVTVADPSPPLPGDAAPREFAFERVFTESASQRTVFADSVQQFVQVFLDGYDFTLICHGQTGAGKTHTLFGPDLPLAMNEADFGSAVRFLREVFLELDRRKEDEDAFEFASEVSFVSVGSDDAVVDLLMDEPDDEALGFRRPPRPPSSKECFGLPDVLSYVGSGLSLQRMRAEDSLDQILGGKIERLGCHLAFTFRLRQTAADRTVESTARFVELAGYDKLALGNRGLVSLDMIVNSLGNPEMRGRSQRPNAGMSALTAMLGDSLGGGGALTLLMCCASTLAADRTETERVIRFASFASNVTNVPRLRALATATGRGKAAEAEDDGNSDLSNIRSASVNRGNLPNVVLSPPDSGGPPTPLASQPPSCNVFPHQMPPVLPPPQVPLPQVPLPPPHILSSPDLFLQYQFEYLKQHYSQLLLTNPQAVSDLFRAPMLASTPLILDAGGPGLNTNSPSAAPFLPSLSSQTSTPLASPLEIKPAFSAQLYLPSAPGGLASAASEDRGDTASLPVSLPSQLVSEQSDEEAKKFEVRERAAAGNNVRSAEQKLASILEESESGSLDRTAATLTTDSSERARARRRTNSDGEDTGGSSSSCSDDDDDFDSECSQVSEEMISAATAAAADATEEAEVQPVLEDEVQKHRTAKFKADTEAIVKEFEENLAFSVESQVSRCEVTEELSAEAEAKLRRECADLRLVQDSIRERKAELEAQTETFKKCMAEPRDPGALARLLEVLSSDSESLYRRVLDKKARLEEEEEEAEEGEAESLDWAEEARWANETRKLELDEKLLAVGEVFEVKNLQLCGRPASSLLASEAADVCPTLDAVLSSLSKEEARALALRRAARSVDLRGLSCRADEEDRLHRARIRSLEEYCELARDDRAKTELRHREDFRRQARENAKKINLMEAELARKDEEREAMRRENAELKQKNTMLLNFYRKNKDRGGGEAAPRSRRGRREDIRMRRSLSRDSREGTAAASQVAARRSHSRERLNEVVGGRRRRSHERTEEVRTGSSLNREGGGRARARPPSASRTKRLSSRSNSATRNAAAGATMTPSKHKNSKR